MDISKIIKSLKNAGLTQKDIAAVAGCTQTNISDLSRGRISNPSFRIGTAIIELAKQKGVYPEDNRP